ncbi:MAG: alpha/beta fold hydrolase [Gammaproteobacteria bacterium]
MNDPNEVSHFFADLSEVRMHYVAAGKGAPVVLLHGWPQTWYEWRDVIPRLAPHYTIIAPDLRGLGDSSRPDSGYDTQTIATDVWELVHNVLGIEAFFLVGHDWGGPVSYALAAAHAQAVTKLAILDVAIPGDGSANISQGGKRWHHAFHQTPDLPEALIAGREALYLGWFYENYGARPDAIAPEAVAEYLRTYSQPGALQAGFNYYRNIPTDIAQNETIVAKFKLPMPVLALGGSEGWGRGTEVLESCRRVATNVGGGVIAGAGHWIPEEQPEVLSEHLLAFFRHSFTS